jgi:hypothetical protein
MSAASVVTAVFVYTMFITFALLMIIGLFGRLMGWSDPSAPMVKKKEKDPTSAFDKIQNSAKNSTKYRPSFAAIRELKSTRNMKHFEERNHMLEYVLDKWKHHSGVKVQPIDNMSDTHEKVAEEVDPENPPLTSSQVTTVSTVKFDPWKLSYTTTVVTTHSNDNEKLNKTMEKSQFSSPSTPPHKITPQKAKQVHPSMEISSIDSHTYRRLESPNVASPDHSSNRTINNRSLDPPIGDRIDNLENMLVKIASKLDASIDSSSTPMKTPSKKDGKRRDKDRSSGGSSRAKLDSTLGVNSGDGGSSVDLIVPPPSINSKKKTKSMKDIMKSEIIDNEVFSDEVSGEDKGKRTKSKSRNKVAKDHVSKLVEKLKNNNNNNSHSTSSASGKKSRVHAEPVMKENGGDDSGGDNDDGGICNNTPTRSANEKGQKLKRKSSRKLGKSKSSIKDQSSENVDTGILIPKTEEIKVDSQDS